MRTNHLTAVLVLVATLVLSQTAFAQTSPQMVIRTAESNTQQAVKAGDILTVETALTSSNSGVSGLIMFLIFNPEYLEVVNPNNPNEPLGAPLEVFNPSLEDYHRGFGYGGIPSNHSNLDNTTVQPSTLGYGYIQQKMGNIPDPGRNLDPNLVIPDGVISTFKLRVLKRPPEGTIVMGPFRSNFKQEKYLGVQTGYFVNENTEVVQAFQTAPQLVISVHPLPEEVILKSDFDGSGRVDFTDFLTFVKRFSANDLIVDLDASGSVDLNDFLAFREAYKAQ